MQILSKIFKHKIIAVIILLAVIAGGYFVYKAVKRDSVKVNYTMAQVERGTIVLSVSGNGQIASVSQADVKARASGDVLAVYVVPGQKVVAGQVVVQLNTADAAKAVRDAQTNLETAKLELDKLLQPADELTLFQAENGLIQAQRSKETAEKNLDKAYDDGFNTVANAFLNLPSVMSGINDILFSRSFSDTQSNLAYYADAASNYDNNVFLYKQAAETDYQRARKQYDKNFLDYKSASRFSSTSTIMALIDQTYETTKNIAEAVKSANNLIQLYQDKLIERSLKPISLSTAHITTLNSYMSVVNGNVSSLLSAQRSITDSIEAIATAERSIKEKTLSLNKVKSEPDELSVRAKKIAIQQKEDALSTAQQILSDCSIRAPFGGVIVKVNSKKGDSISSGATLATLVSEQKVAEISLNEIDAANVKVGQKATLTFDAIDGLTLAGKVDEIDVLGTITQAVVTYNVKIVFEPVKSRIFDGVDAQDYKVKSGMSVSAAIITQVKQNVFLVPNSAIKTSGESSYVEVFNNTLENLPSQQLVEIGLTNDLFTEIVSGISEGDQVITQTITANSSQSNQSQRNSGFNPGMIRMIR